MYFLLLFNFKDSEFENRLKKSVNSELKPKSKFTDHCVAGVSIFVAVSISIRLNTFECPFVIERNVKSKA